MSSRSIEMNLLRESKIDTMCVYECICGNMMLWAEKMEIDNMPTLF